MFQSMAVKEHPKTYLKLVILLATTMPVMAGALVSPALPALSAAFEGTPSIDLLSRLVLTFPAFFIGLTAPLAGWIIDKFGRTLLLKVALTIYGLAGLSIMFMQDIYIILVARAIMGITVGGVLTTITTLIGDFFKGEARSKMLGIQAGVMALSATLFSFAGGFLSDLGWQYPFAMYGIAILLAPLVHLAIPEPERDEAQERKEQAEADGQRLPIVLLVMAYGMAFIGMAAFYLMPTQVPFILSHEFGQSGGVIGMTLAIVTLGAAFVATQYKAIKDFVGDYFSFVFAIAFLLTAIGFLIIFFSTALWHVLVAMAFTGIGSGLILPNANLWISHLAPAARRGTLLGLLSLFLFWGQFFSPVIFEPIRSANTTKGGFGIAAIFLVSFTIVMVTLVRWRLRVLKRKGLR